MAPSSMRWSWIALGAGAYVAFAIASLPAATAYHWFAPEQLRLAGISGTAWSGSAELGSVPGLAMRELRWRLNPGALLLGRVTGRFEARLADGFVTTNATATASRVRFEDARAGATLATLSRLLPLGDARAELGLSLDELVLADGWPVDAVGTARIGGLAVPPLLDASGQLIEIGSFAVTLTGSGGQGLVGTVDDTSGPLEVADGVLSLGADRRYALRGRVRARSEASEELVRGVEMMTGEPDVDGLRPFEFLGSL